MKRLSDFIFALAVTGALTTAPAHAYLDGATISLAIQAITGATATVLIVGKTQASRLLGLFRRKDRSGGRPS